VTIAKNSETTKAKEGRDDMWIIDIVLFALLVLLSVVCWPIFWPIEKLTGKTSLILDILRVCWGIILGEGEL
jgi:hypothetical protein